MATLNVRARDGMLVAGSPLGPLRLVQVEPLLFREELGTLEVAFRTDAGGRPTHAFVSLVPMMAAEPCRGTVRRRCISRSSVAGSSSSSSSSSRGW